MEHVERDDSELRWMETEFGLPLPLLKDNAATAFLLEITDIEQELNQEPLRVTGLVPGMYSLTIDGKEVGKFSEVALGGGVNLADYNTPMRQQAQRVSWMVRITEFEWNSHFCDEQVRGPFEHYKHCHWIAAEVRDGVEGTLVTDSIEFELPYGGVGQMGVGFVRANLKKSFAYRQKRLPQILAAAARQAVKRA